MRDSHEGEKITGEKHGCTDTDIQGGEEVVLIWKEGRLRYGISE